METPAFSFTNSGLLVPAKGIETDLEAFEDFFVHNFPNSESRSRIFENYMQYSERLQMEVFPWFEQWVDGSFVTLKENPKDIDVVTFLDHEVYDLREKALEKFWGFNFEFERIDAYIVKVFPEGHPEYMDFLSDLEYWHYLFVHNRGLEEKGFLKLNFGREIK